MRHENAAFSEAEEVDRLRAENARLALIIKGADELGAAVLDLVDGRNLDSRSRAADRLSDYAQVRCDVHGDEINAFRSLLAE